ILRFEDRDLAVIPKEKISESGERDGIHRTEGAASAILREDAARVRKMESMVVDRAETGDETRPADEAFEIEALHEFGIFADPEDLADPEKSGRIERRSLHGKRRFRSDRRENEVASLGGGGKTFRIGLESPRAGLEFSDEELVKGAERTAFVFLHRNFEAGDEFGNGARADRTRL